MIMQKYLSKEQTAMVAFQKEEIHHITKEHNFKEDLPSKLVSSKTPWFNKKIVYETLLNPNLN